jgi:hypothetical protein
MTLEESSISLTQIDVAVGDSIPFQRGTTEQQISIVQTIREQFIGTWLEAARRFDIDFVASKKLFNPNNGNTRNIILNRPLKYHAAAAISPR